MLFRNKTETEIKEIIESSMVKISTSVEEIASVQPQCETYTKPRVVARNDSFVAYDNGMVYDSETGLEWYVGPDEDTTWEEAKKWVDNLSVNGERCRMPTIKELKSLYKKGVGSRNMPPLLKTTGWWVWSGETWGSISAWGFYFFNGDDFWLIRLLHPRDSRAFAVRFRK